jgi:DNA-binding MarR family transcriptional regulator
MSAIDDAIVALRTELSELDSERKRLENALAALTGPATSKRKRTNSRAPKGQRQDQLLKYLKKNPGARPSEAAKALGISPSNVQAVIRKARDEKRIKKSGKGYALTA